MRDILKIQVQIAPIINSYMSVFLFKWNRICTMETDDRRACPIFRIERGTFQESHTRILNFEYPSSNEEENVILRITKLSLSESSSLLLSSNDNQSNIHNNLSIIQNNDLYNTNSQVFGETKTKSHRTRKHSLSDDYVFL